MPGATMPCSMGKRGSDIWKYCDAGGSTRRLRMTEVTLRMRTFWVYTPPTAAGGGWARDAGGG